MSDETLQYPAKITEEPFVRPKDEHGRFIPRSSVKGLNGQLPPPLRPKRIIPTAEAATVEYCNYLPPPKAMLPANDCYDLPEGSGIYFVWANNRIVYVGKSTRLWRRCCFKTHPCIRQNEHLSWLEMPSSELFFAECYYIGALRPERNKGHGPILRETP